MTHWFKIDKRCLTEEEALAFARVYALEPYVKDYYVKKARKYYYPILEIDLYELKHAKTAPKDDPFV